MGGPVVALNSVTWAGIITIVMLIGSVGVVIVWWFFMNPPPSDEG